jgi:hypothetical protein
METKQAEFIPKLIIDIISEKTGITYNQMYSKTRKREYVEARHLAMFFIKKYTSLTLTKIGMLFGGRDHTSVLAALERVNDLQFYSEYKLRFVEYDTEIGKIVKMNTTDQLIKYEIKRINTIRKYNHLPSHELARMILSNAV